MIAINFPGAEKFFLDEVGTSYSRLECEAVTQELLELVPPDIESVLYIGADERLPDYLLKLPIKTLDINPDTKPDIVADIRDTRLPSASYELIFLVNVLEHVFEFDKAIAECYRLLESGGYLLVSVPWIYPYHGQDSMNDYWRMSREALKVLLKDFDEVNATQRHWNSYALATK
jgi:SAM-dependent methyltransferase